MSETTETVTPEETTPETPQATEATPETAEPEVEVEVQEPTQAGEASADPAAASTQPAQQAASKPSAHRLISYDFSFEAVEGATGYVAAGRWAAQTENPDQPAVVDLPTQQLSAAKRSVTFDVPEGAEVIIEISAKDATGRPGAAATVRFVAVDPERGPMLPAPRGLAMSSVEISGTCDPVAEIRAAQATRAAQGRAYIRDLADGNMGTIDGVNADGHLMSTIEVDGGTATREFTAGIDDDRVQIVNFRGQPLGISLTDAIGRIKASIESAPGPVAG